MHSYLGTFIPEGPKSLESFGGQEKRPRDLLRPCNWVTAGMSCRLSWYRSTGTISRVLVLLELQINNTQELSPNLLIPFP